MAEGIRIGIRSVDHKIYTGEITTASQSYTITIPNPSEDAQNIEKIWLTKEYSDWAKTPQMAVAFPKSGRILTISFQSTSSAAPVFGLIGKVTVNDDSIVIESPSTTGKFEASTYHWEVTCVE